VAEPERVAAVMSPLKPLAALTTLQAWLGFPKLLGGLESALRKGF
jgi:hypothetical protein